LRPKIIPKEFFYPLSIIFHRLCIRLSFWGVALQVPPRILLGFIHAAAGAHGFRVNAGPVHVPLKNPNDQNYVVNFKWNGNDTGETILYIIKFVFLYGLVVNDDNQ